MGRAEKRARSARAAAFAASLLCVLCASPAAAEDLSGRAALAHQNETPFDLTTTFGVDTTGVFRGVKSRRLNPSVWATLDVEYGDIYAGVFGQPAGFEDETVPLFYSYGGVAPSAFGVDFNFGASYYAFPGSSLAGFDTDGDDIIDHTGRKGLFEAFAGIGKTFDVAELTFLSFYSPDMYGETGRAWYHAADVSVPLAEGFTLALHAGANRFANSLYNDDYVDYAVGLEKTVAGFDLALRYSNVAALAGADESVVFFSVSRQFSLFSRGERQERRFGKVRNNWVVDKGLLSRR